MTERELSFPPPPGNLEAILLGDCDCAYVLLELGLMVLPFDCSETQSNERISFWTIALAYVTCKKK